jgi:hypothetical protein
VVVIGDLTRSLTALLRDRLDGAEVRTGRPEAGWSGGKSAFLSVSLVKVAEARDRRRADWADVRDADGGVLGRVAPTRWFRCTYLVGAFAPDPVDEHDMLGRVLAASVELESLPAGHLQGGLADEAEPIVLSVAARGIDAVDWWEAAGLAPRAVLEVVLVAPVRPALDTEVAPPAQSLTLDARRIPGAEQAAAAAAVAGERRWTAFRIRENAPSDDA